MCPRRRALLVSTVMAVVLGCTGCAHASTALNIPGDSEPVRFGVIVSDLPLGVPYSASGFGVCAEERAPIRIDSLTPMEPVGFELSNFGTNGPESDFGDARVPLAETEFNVDSPEVTVPCPDSFTHLGFEMRRTQPGVTGTADGFTIGYTDATGERGEYFFPFYVTLCDPDDTVTQDCSSPPQ